MDGEHRADMTLLYIAKDPKIALAAEASGVDFVFVDLELRGKQKRQGHLDTVISEHTISDVQAVRSVLTHSELLVRINPWDPELSPAEVDEAVEAGADAVMLPYFKTAAEVSAFLNTVSGRAATWLLLETADAVSNVDEIVRLQGIDRIHVGLNDLHLDYGLSFMFELLTDGTIEMLASKFQTAGLPFGFGGVGRIGEGALPATSILTEHRRLGSTAVILSRTFLANDTGLSSDDVKDLLHEEVAKLRNYLSELDHKANSFFTENTRKVKASVESVVSLQTWDGK